MMSVFPICVVNSCGRLHFDKLSFKGFNPKKLDFFGFLFN